MSTSHSKNALEPSSPGNQDSAPAKLSDELTPADLWTAHKVNELVVKFLKTRYMVLFWGAMILAPILGIVGGAIIESQLFSNSMDRMLKSAEDTLSAKVAKANEEVTATVSNAKGTIFDQVKLAKSRMSESVADAKSSISEAETEAKVAANEARKDIAVDTKESEGHLAEIRSTRAALEYVMKGTQTGALAQQQKRSKELEEQVKKFEEQLSDLEVELQQNYPDRVGSLFKAAKDTASLKEAVQNISKVLEEGGEAKALAGAFFKIYEFLGKLELEFYVSDHVNSDDLESLIQSASSLKARITFSESGIDAENSKMVWVGVTPAISYAPRIIDNKVVQKKIEVMSPLGNLGHVSEKVLLVSLALDDNSDWWQIDGPEDKVVKLIDLRDVAQFNSIKIEFEFPEDKEADREILHSACMLSGNLASPRTIRFRGNVNRVAVNLLHDNFTIDKPENVFSGSVKTNEFTPGKTEVKPAKGVKPESAVKPQLGNVAFEFSSTPLFRNSKEEYVNGLK